MKKSKKNDTMMTMNDMGCFSIDPKDDELSDDTLALMFSGIPAFISVLLSVISAMNSPWTWTRLFATLMVAVMSAIMIAFWSSLMVFHGSITWFFRIALAVACVMLLILLLLGGVGWVMFLMVLTLFLLFILGEYLCLQ